MEKKWDFFVIGQCHWTITTRTGLINIVVIMINSRHKFFYLTANPSIVTTFGQVFATIASETKDICIDKVALSQMSKEFFE